MALRSLAVPCCSLLGLLQAGRLGALAVQSRSSSAELDWLAQLQNSRQLEQSERKTRRLKHPWLSVLPG